MNHQKAPIVNIDGGTKRITTKEQRKKLSDQEYLDAFYSKNKRGGFNKYAQR